MQTSANFYASSLTHYWAESFLCDLIVDKRYMYHQELPDHENLTEATLFEVATKHGLTLASGSFSTDGTSPSGVFTAGDSVVVFIGSLQYESPAINVWGASKEDARSVCAALHTAFPKKKVQNSNDVPFAFWRATATGADYSVRDLACPAWEEIAQNYPDTVKSRIIQVVDMQDPTSVGKVILWHGTPGTGKTYAVRALAREWATKLDATVEVILDYENVFANAEYMSSVLLDDGVEKDLKRRMCERRGVPVGEGTPLRLIIIEDGASLFATGCRNTNGFSRFLNLTDGLIGQGLKTVFVLTANEEIGSIDEAVYRTGRCLQELNFAPFSECEASAWLTSHGSNEVAKQCTLAGLYAQLNGKSVQSSQHGGLGF